MGQVQEPARQQKLLAEMVEEGLTEEQARQRVAEELGKEEAFKSLLEKGVITKGPGRIPFTRAEILYLLEYAIRPQITEFLHERGKRAALRVGEPVTGKTLWDMVLEEIKGLSISELKGLLFEQVGRMLAAWNPADPHPYFDLTTQKRVGKAEGGEDSSASP